MAAGGSRITKKGIPEDLSNVEFETSEDVEVVSTFDTMGLREDLLRGIYAYGKNELLLFIIILWALAGSRAL